MKIKVNALGEFNALAHDGSRQAAQSLGQLTGIHPIAEATSIDLVRHRDIVAELHDREFVAISSKFSGGIDGTAILVFDEPGARTLAKSLSGGSEGQTDLEPRLTEIGNIMLSGFLDGWADYLQRGIDQAPPTYHRGTGRELLPDSMTDETTSRQSLTINTMFETSDAVVETAAYIKLQEDSLATVLGEAAPHDAVPIPLDKLQLFSEMAARGGDTAGDNLSMMAGIETAVNISRMSFLQIEQIVPRLGDERHVGVVSELTGLPSGYMMVLFDEPSAAAIAEAMGAGPVDGEFEQIHRSAVQEIGNIMISGFVDGWANVLDTSNQHTPPEFVHDFASAIADPIVIDLATAQEHVFAFDTLIQTTDDTVSCQLLALPEADELATALTELPGGQFSPDVAAQMDADPQSVFGDTGN